MYNESFSVLSRAKWMLDAWAGAVAEAGNESEAVAGIELGLWPGLLAWVAGLLAGLGCGRFKVGPFGVRACGPQG